MRKYNGHLHRKYTFQNEEKYKVRIERRDTHMCSDGEKMQRPIKICNIIYIVQRIKIYFRHRFKLSIYLWSSQICKVLGKLTKSQIRWQWAPHGGWTWTQSKSQWLRMAKEIVLTCQPRFHFRGKADLPSTSLCYISSQWPPILIFRKKTGLCSHWPACRWGLGLGTPKLTKNLRFILFF